MLQSEFIERTNYYPTCDEYRAIEELYYRFKEGDKDAFCKNFVENKEEVLHSVHALACQMFPQERERLLKAMHTAEAQLHEEQRYRKMENAAHEREYKRLEAERAEYEKSARELMKAKQETIERLNERIIELEREAIDLRERVKAYQLVISVNKED